MVLREEWCGWNCNLRGYGSRYDKFAYFCALKNEKNRISRRVVSANVSTG